MTNNLYDILKEMGTDPIPEAFADALWLSKYVPAAEPSSVNVPDAPGRSRQQRTESPEHTGHDHQRDGAQSNHEGQEDEPRADIHPHTHETTATDGQGIPVQKFRSPRGTALQNQLNLVRSLRPLKRTTSSRTRFTVDIRATIQSIADRDEWTPILMPLAERWLDVVLLVDEWSSMVIWHQVVRELQTVIEQSGTFRRVQVWGMQPTGKDVHTTTQKIQPKLHEGWGFGTADNRERSATELINPSNNQLILMISDCVSPAWTNGEVGQLLKEWQASNTVVIVQMLPQTLWSRTALGYAEFAWMRFPAASVPNAKLVMRTDDWDDDDLAGFEEDVFVESDTVAVPVVTLDDDLLMNCTKAIAGASTQWVAGYQLPIDGYTEFGDSDTEEEKPSFSATRKADKASSLKNSVSLPPTAQQRIAQFQATASPPAQRLAGYFSTVPLTLPIMHTVQHVMMPESTTGHLAEVFLSGLIERPAPETVKDVHPSKIQYEFVDGVRSRLQSTLLKSDALAVLTKTKLAQFVDSRTGQSLDFAALIENPDSVEYLVMGKGNGIPFTTIDTDLLSRLGKRYRSLSIKIRSALIKTSVDDKKLNLAKSVTRLIQKHDKDMPLTIASLKQLKYDCIEQITRMKKNGPRDECLSCREILRRAVINKDDDSLDALMSITEIYIVKPYLGTICPSNLRDEQQNIAQNILLYLFKRIKYPKQWPYRIGTFAEYYKFVQITVQSEIGSQIKNINRQQELQEKSGLLDIFDLGIDKAIEFTSEEINKIIESRFHAWANNANEPRRTNKQRQWEAINLRHFESRTISEIAQHFQDKGIDITERKVSSLIATGMQRIRKDDWLRYIFEFKSD
ncbi:MAG: SAV_2336 N-terminal domain-related protein [Chloroflexota bacterium]